MAESFSPDTVMLAVERLLERFPPEAPRDTVLRSVP